MTSNASTQISSFTTESFHVKRLSRSGCSWNFAAGGHSGGPVCNTAIQLYRFHLEKQMHFMMDTYVTVYASAKTKTQPAINALWTGCRRGCKFSMHNPDSPVYAFNNHNVPSPTAKSSTCRTGTADWPRIRTEPLTLPSHRFLTLGILQSVFSTSRTGRDQRCLNLVGYSNFICRTTNFRRRRQI